MVFNANLEATIASYFVSTILPSLLENATDPDLLRVIEHVATRIQSQEVEASGDIFAWILESVKVGNSVTYPNPLLKLLT